MAYMQYGKKALGKIITDTSLRSSDSLVNPLQFACQGLRYRKLEVILTTSMKNLGKAGETVKVAPGYFRNHLMPKLLAVPNIEKYAFLIREQRKIYQPEEEEEEVEEVKESKEDIMKDYEKAARRLDNSKLVLRRLINAEKFRSRATEDEPIELLSPVTKDEIIAEVERQLCVRISPENLHLPSPLTMFGEFELPLRLPKSIPLPEGKVQWTLTVKIRGK